MIDVLIIDVILLTGKWDSSVLSFQYLKPLVQSLSQSVIMPSSLTGT